MENLSALPLKSLTVYLQKLSMNKDDLTLKKLNVVVVKKKNVNVVNANVVNMNANSVKMKTVADVNACRVVPTLTAIAPVSVVAVPIVASVDALAVAVLAEDSKIQLT